MESAEIPLIPLLIVLGLAFLVPLLVGRVRRLFIPTIIGEILAGMAVGRSGFDLIRPHEALEILSTLGFIFLMFLSGLEISFSGAMDSAGRRGMSAWRRILATPIAMAAVLFLGTLALSLLAAAALAALDLTRSPWIMALILSTSSLGVIVPVLKEENLAGTPFGQQVLHAALVADFGSILLISVYVLFLRRGLTADLLLVLILFAAFAGIYRLAGLFRKHLPADRIFEEVSSATSQIRLRGALALTLVFTVLARSVGTETILGAFLAGVIVSMLTGEDRSVLREKLDAVGYGFLIPIFFVMVGVEFDLPALLASKTALLLLPAFVAAAFLVKSIPALLLRLRFSWRESLSGGILLSSRLSLIIAVAAIGLELGLISRELNSAIILVAVATCTLSPLLFKLTAPEAPGKRRRIVVMGCRHFAELLHQRLERRGLDVATFCTEGGERREAEAGAHSFRRRETVSRELRRAGADRARTVVALEERDEDNLLICRTAKVMFGVESLVAWVQDSSLEGPFRRMGVRIVNPARSTLFFIEAMAAHPELYPQAREIDAGLGIREVKIKGEALAGRSLVDLRLPASVTVMGIVRSGEFLVPDNRTRLQANDRISLMGFPEELEKAVEGFRRRAR